MITVYFVDYGFKREVDSRHVRIAIIPEALKLSIQGVWCILEHIAPKPRINECWPTQTIHNLKALLFNQLLHAQFTRKGELLGVDFKPHSNSKNQEATLLKLRDQFASYRN